jgi:hypothetical protein
VGTLDQETMQRQRQLNQHANAHYGGEASLLLLDIVTLQDTKQDVCTPRTLAQLRYYLVERAKAMWLVLLGSHHPVTQQHHAYWQYLVLHGQRLDRVTTCNPRRTPLLPALLGRVIQMEVNTWLMAQAQQAQPLCPMQYLQ